MWECLLLWTQPRLLDSKPFVSRLELAVQTLLVQLAVLYTILSLSLFTAFPSIEYWVTLIAWF